MPRRSHLPPDLAYPARDPRVRPRYLRLPSGLTVRVVQCGSDNGTPVILLPGLGVSSFTYRHQLPALGAAGYQATAVDLKGHGFSDKPTGRGEYAFAAMVAHVEEVVDTIAGDRRPVVVGQSMSGLLAIRLGIERRSRVSALVLIGPVGLGVIPLAGLARLLTPRLLDPVAPYLARRSLVRVGLRLVYSDPRRVTDEIVDEYWAPAQFPGFARAVRALIHDFPWAPLPKATLAEIDERTLILLGAHDRVVRKADERARGLSRPTTVVVADGGHAVNEECPDAVNAAMLAFLRRVVV